MDTYISRNISVVPILIQQSVSEYQLPKNVDWAGKKIDKMLLVAPVSSTCLSPVDGQTPILNSEQIQNLYFDIYAGDETELAQSMFFENILYTKPYPIEINNTIALNLSSIRFATQPTENGILLLYVYWGGCKCENFEIPRRSVTITFPLLANQRLTFREIINTYVHADYHNVKGLSVWKSEQNPAYITLRDYKLQTDIKSLYTGLARPQILIEPSSTDVNTQLNSLYLDNIDIDFDYSFIRNATAQNNQQTITIYY